jgi:hypothetical protein
MTKQEYMAMSLPYDLQVVNEKGVRKTYAAVHYSYEFEPDFEKFTPILHPLSDLTKKIEHKGEKFVPIVELAKIAEGIGIKVLGYKQKSLVFGVKYISEEGIECVFAFHQEWQAFAVHSISDRLFDICLYQLKLFKLLIKWHFDIADLISKGEAIDVNTLDINPYK